MGGAQRFSSLSFGGSFVTIWIVFGQIKLKYTIQTKAIILPNPKDDGSGFDSRPFLRKGGIQESACQMNAFPWRGFL